MGGGFRQRLQEFARSPEGRRALDEARLLAKNPARRKQLQEAQRRLASPNPPPAAARARQ